MSGTYLKFPLALLRLSESPEDFVDRAARYAAVNAGRGFEANHGREQFTARAEEVASRSGIKTNRADLHAIVGADVCGITLGDPTGRNAAESFHATESARGDSPFVTMKAAVFWNAANTVRREAGQEAKYPDKPISWREFRLLAALSSNAPNRWGFTIMGWESFQRRACGFHNREGFEAFEALPEPWPDHLLPLSRKVIRTTLARLEVLQFFIRHNISTGSRGGLTAYSFRHSEGSLAERRSALAKDCASWQAFRSADKNREARAKDRVLHLREKSEREKRIAALQAEAEALAKPLRENAVKSPAKPHESSKGPSPTPPQDSSGPSEGQPRAKVGPRVGPRVGPSGGPSQGQHNEKDLSEKDCNQKDSIQKDRVTGARLRQRDADEKGEVGYLMNGTFIPNSKLNELVRDKPSLLDELSRNAKPAERFVASDGSTSIREVAAA
jgi:hypothetical protein